MNLLLPFFWTVVIIGLYFLPAISAYEKKKKDKVAILALNFFLGWTMLGWIIALVWSLKKD